MSLDVDLYVGDARVAEFNFTHNLTKMASEAGIYRPLWRGDEDGITTARQIYDALEPKVRLLAEDRERFEKFDAENGWGTWESFVPRLYVLLGACAMYPDARVEFDR
jgi:hypothetical protein